MRYTIVATNEDANAASMLASELSSHRFNVNLDLRYFSSLAELSAYVHGTPSTDRIVLLLSRHTAMLIDSLVEFDELMSWRRDGDKVVHAVLAVGSDAPPAQFHDLAQLRGACERSKTVSHFANLEGRSVMDHAMTSTTFDLAGFRIVRTLGIVRGLVVRSTSVVGSFVGGLQTIFGGKNDVYGSLCEQTRAEAFSDMVRHAEAMGATGIVGIRFDANEVIASVTEVLCYGTAVQVEPCQ